MKNLKTGAITPLVIGTMALAFTGQVNAANSVQERTKGFKTGKHSVAAIEDAINQGDKITVAEQARLLGQKKSSDTLASIIVAVLSVLLGAIKMVA